eukprot:m.184963 g.184963  ORF g.184963 m.184963 type:complete len:339 (-) comp21562_c0_seq5:117-1133(-)
MEPEEGVTKDLFSDGCAVKRRLVPGTPGTSPVEGDGVDVEYCLLSINGNLLPDEPATQARLTLSASDMIEGWWACLCSMTVGEQARLRVAPSRAYGDAGWPPRIPPHATLDFRLTLQAVHRRPQPLQQRSTAEIAELAGRAKTHGNDLFQKQRYAAACKHYLRASMILDTKTDEASSAELKSLQIAVNNNMAACHVKLQSHENVLTCCGRVLALDPKNAKAYYRRGLAHERLNRLAEAEQDLALAVQYAPDDHAAKKDHSRITQLLQKKREEEREMCQRMLGTKSGQLSDKLDKMSRRKAKTTHKKDTPIPPLPPTGIQELCESDGENSGENTGKASQ